MRFCSLLLPLLLAACQAPLPPATPPLPSTPPPPPPERAFNGALVTGRVTDLKGNPVRRTWVTIRAADAACRSIPGEVGAITDDDGRFHGIVEAVANGALPGCAIVEGVSGGARGIVTAPARFAVDPAERQPVAVELRLDRVQPLTAAGAREIVELLVRTIEEPSMGIPAELSLFSSEGFDEITSAVELYRTVLGTDVSIHPLPEQISGETRLFPFELRGNGGRTLRADVRQDALIRLSGPVLADGVRSQRFILSYIRAISSGDAAALARLLSNSDREFSLDQARSLVISYRLRFDTGTLSPEFVDLDESRQIITWRLRGRDPAGREASEEIRLDFSSGGLRLAALPAGAG